MDSKRKIFDKSHPARQHVIDFTDLSSDTEQPPKASLKPSIVRASTGQLSGPVKNPDVKPNFTSSQDTTANGWKKIIKNPTKNQRSTSRGTSRAEPIEIGDSEDEPLPQVNLRIIVPVAL